MTYPKITGGIYYPNWNWGKIVGEAKVDPKAQAEYDAKMAKYQQAIETMKKNGYTIDSNNGGVISFSQIARRTTDANGKVVETIIPRGDKAQSPVTNIQPSTTKIGDALVNYSTASASPAASTNTFEQQKPDFSKFASNNTLTYQAKTKDDYTEAEKTLLDAGYIKVGTDENGKGYYEKRISKNGNTNKPTNESNAKSDFSVPETIEDSVKKYSDSSSSASVSTPTVVSDVRDSGVIPQQKIEYLS